jgi:hypothetical protein
MEIVFTNMSDFAELEPPRPASEFIPDWYKKMESYIGGDKKPGGDAATLATIKRCMPVFDSLTAGYIISTPADVWITHNEDGSHHYEWRNFGLISFHPVTQAPTYPNASGFSYPKFNNLWGVRTPKGYSSLFVAPFHREGIFTILPGIVDTDQYYAPVNFPFIVNDRNFEGLIPAGTPIAQVIPFKRDNWKMRYGDLQDFQDTATNGVKLNTKFFDRYKHFFRTVKEYK